MKAEELLNSMDYIGEDLLAEAEQTILVKTKRPWLKTAVAAVLVAAIGVSGWLFLKNVNMKPSISATNPSIIKPIPTDTQIDTTELPVLEVGDSWKMIPAPEYCLTENAPTLCDPAITALPVYAVNPECSTSHTLAYNERQLQSILEKVIHSLGVSCTEDYHPLYSSADSPEDLTLVNMQAKTDIGEITVTTYGNVYVNLSKSIGIAQVKELLKLPESSYVYSSENSTLRIIPALEDPVEQVMVCSFGGIILYCNSHDLNIAAVDMIVWHQSADAADWNDCSQDWRVCLGYYPLLTQEEARAYAQNGYYFSSEYFSGKLTENLLSYAELVYSDFTFVTDFTGIQIPYYRFWSRDGFSDEYVCVPAVRPEYLSDFPENTSVTPEETDPIDTEPETTAPLSLDPELVEQTLSAWENGLNDEYFSRCFVQDPNDNSTYNSTTYSNFSSYSYSEYTYYYSDGHTRIWQENDDILKKDLATGEIETIFTLEHNEEITTRLEGVTKNRLYFGWNEVEDWWGVNVYSVDYHNENRIDLAEAMFVRFGGGWLRMESFSSDVRPFTLQVIDRNDQLIVDESMGGERGVCWGDTVVDDSLYYVVDQYYKWCLSLSRDEYDGIPDEEKSKHEQYDVCRVDPDGSITTIGTVAGSVSTSVDFKIIADRHELVYDGPYFGEAVPEEIPDVSCTYRYDLDTLTLKSGPKLFRELPMDRLDTGREVGVGINILRNDAKYVIFYNYFGLFGFDGTTGAPLFYLDFDEVLDRQGFTQIQGSGGGTNCRLIKANLDRWKIDNSIMIVFENEERNFTQCFILDLDEKYCYDPVPLYEEPDEYWESVSSYCNTEFVTSPYGGRTMAELWIEHNGEKWYPFRAE